MREEHKWQCQVCGAIHTTDREYKTEDIFVRLWCSQCRKETTQLYVGKNDLEFHEYANPNLDSRFFIY